MLTDLITTSDLRWLTKTMALVYNSHAFKEFLLKSTGLTYDMHLYGGGIQNEPTAYPCLVSIGYKHKYYQYLDCDWTLLDQVTSQLAFVENSVSPTN